MTDVTDETDVAAEVERRAYYAAGMLDAARMVGTRAHMSELQDADQGVAITLRYLETAITQRANGISRGDQTPGK